MNTLELLHNRIELLEAAVTSLLKMNYKFSIGGTASEIKSQSARTLIEFSTGAEGLWEKWGADENGVSSKFLPKIPE